MMRAPFFLGSPRPSWVRFLNTSLRMTRQDPEELLAAHVATTSGDAPPRRMPKSAIAAAWALYAAAIDFTAKAGLDYAEIRIEIQSAGSKSYGGPVFLTPPRLGIGPTIPVTALIFAGNLWSVRTDHRPPQERTARGWSWLYMENKPNEKVRPLAVPREGRRGEFDYRVQVATWEEVYVATGKEKLTIFNPWAPPSTLWIIPASQAIRNGTKVSEIIKVLRTALYERCVSNDERLQLIGYAQQRINHHSMEMARRAPEFNEQNRELLEMFADQYGWRAGGG